METAQKRAANRGRASTGLGAMRAAVLAGWQVAVRIARAAIGVPDYPTYLAHQRRHHPERTPMSYEAFFAERQAARYRGGGGRCC